MTHIDWAPCTKLLEVLTSQIVEIQTLVVSATRPEQADQLADLCGRLAQNMAQALPVLQQQLGQAQPPAEVLAQLALMQRGLGDLRTRVTVQGSSVARALNILFPNDTSHNSYSSLGDRGLGGNRIGSRAYLKA
jgi:hypothetical protein